MDPNSLEIMDQVSKSPEFWAVETNKESATDGRSEPWKDTLQAKEKSKSGGACEGGDPDLTPDSSQPPDTSVPSPPPTTPPPITTVS